MKEIPGPVVAHIGHPRIRQSNRWVSNVQSWLLTKLLRRDPATRKLLR
jgi:hypothetical protein